MIDFELNIFLACSNPAALHEIIMWSIVLVFFM